jgi:hypothetical protein
MGQEEASIAPVVVERNRGAFSDNENGFFLQLVSAAYIGRGIRALVTGVCHFIPGAL